MNEQHETPIDQIEQIPLPVHKFVTLDDFNSIEFREGKEFSLITGSFDMLHANHIQAIKSVSIHSPFNYLVIAVDSDEWVIERKGIHRPFMPFEVRSITLAMLSEVDYIVKHDGDNYGLIEAVRPDLLMISEDPKTRIKDIELVKSFGGETKTLSRGMVSLKDSELSTSNLTRLVASKLVVEA